MTLKVKLCQRRPRKLPPIISAQGLAKRYGAAPLSKHFVYVSEGDRIGVMGRMVRASRRCEMLIGRVKPDSGIGDSKGTRLSYVSQISEFAEV